MEQKLDIPECVGFIMDGNRRWATERGLDSHEGHLGGYESLKKLITVVGDAQIPHMVCYAFSTENWKRHPDEVSYLMELFRHGLLEFKKELGEQGKKLNVRFIGERERFEESMQENMLKLEQNGCTNPSLTVWIALSYGGRAEIVSAVNRAIENEKPVTEESFGKLLWTDGMPDPDLIIRTSGEERLSNFLLWQSAYSELFFTETKWPDFGEIEFKSILDEYGKRQRRRGR